jgi:hypothetical protein
MDNIFAHDTKGIADSMKQLGLCIRRIYIGETCLFSELQRLIFHGVGIGGCLVAVERGLSERIQKFFQRAGCLNAIEDCEYHIEKIRWPSRPVTIIEVIVRLSRSGSYIRLWNIARRARIPPIFEDLLGINTLIIKWLLAL